MMNISSTSPDGKHSLELVYRSEIRFGPAYYRCFINERPIRGKIFGSPYLWSSDCRFLVLQEWSNTDERSGPDTSLFICNLSESMYHAGTRAKGGFISPVRFEGAELVYRTEFYGTAAERSESRIEPAEIGQWKSLALGKPL